MVTGGFCRAWDPAVNNGRWPQFSHSVFQDSPQRPLPPAPSRKSSGFSILAFRRVGGGARVRARVQPKRRTHARAPFRSGLSVAVPGRGSRPLLTGRGPSAGVARRAPEQFRLDRRCAPAVVDFAQSRSRWLLGSHLLPRDSSLGRSFVRWRERRLTLRPSLRYCQDGRPGLSCGSSQVSTRECRRAGRPFSHNPTPR